jgi:hypothetical protein
LVLEEAKLEREVRALDGDGGVDAGGVPFEDVKLVGWEGGDGAVGGDAKLESALEAVVDEEAGAEDLGESAGCVTAEGVHLPEAILCGDEALGEEEVVERGGADVGDAVDVALDGDGSGEARDVNGTVELGEGVVHGLTEPVAGCDEACDRDEDDERGEDDEEAAEDAAASGLQRGFFGGEGFVGNYVRVGEMGQIHDLATGLNRKCKWCGNGRWVLGLWGLMSVSLRLLLNTGSGCMVEKRVERYWLG